MPDTYDPNDPNIYSHHHRNHHFQEEFMTGAGHLQSILMLCRNLEYVYRRVAPVVKAIIEKELSKRGEN